MLPVKILGTVVHFVTGAFEILKSTYEDLDTVEISEQKLAIARRKSKSIVIFPGFARSWHYQKINPKAF
jgi:hypothetical protein